MESKELLALQMEFKNAWQSVKSLLDQQADELKTQSLAFSQLAQAQAEQDEVLKAIIDKLN